MGTTSLWAVQQAIYAKLTSDATLMGLIKGVFDAVPDNQPMPYVVIGEGTEVPFRTFTSTSYVATITLHIWSGAKGYKEGLAILDRLNTLLDRVSLTVSGFQHIYCEYEFSNTTQDPDGSRHIPVRYKLENMKN